MNTKIIVQRLLWASLCVLTLALTGWVKAYAGTVTYYYTDPQGTPLAEADAQGNITATFDYRPYGAQALGTPPKGPGYTGHVNDPDTGLVYMQARYYDPVVGRFLSKDPVGPSAGNASNFTRYTYASNNPILNVDPDGRNPDPAGGCDVGASCETYSSEGGWAGTGHGSGSQDSGSSSSGAPDSGSGGTPINSLQTAQSSAMTDPNLQPGRLGAASHCREATCQIARAMNVDSTPLGPESGGFYNANTQVANLAAVAATQGTEWHQIGIGEAQGYANLGNVVIIGWANPGGGSGHTVTVTPDFNNKNAATNPTVAQVGGSTGNGTMSFRNAFGADKRGSVKVYVYIKK
jgi:RHS repeat-associated protein